MLEGWEALFSPLSSPPCLEALQARRGLSALRLSPAAKTKPCRVWATVSSHEEPKAPAPSSRREMSQISTSASLTR